MGWRGALLCQTWAQRQLVTLECSCRGRHMLPRELPHLPGAACQAGHLLWSRASPSDSHLLPERLAPSGLQPVKKLQETDLAPPAACFVPPLHGQPCGVSVAVPPGSVPTREGGSAWLSWAPAESLATGAPGQTLAPASPPCYSRPWGCRRSDQVTAQLAPPLRGPSPPLGLAPPLRGAPPPLRT